jgi:hypothetical protein
MSRKLTAIAFLAAMVLVVSSAFGQTTKKKKKKKHPKPAATATIELDDKAPPTPAPGTPADATATPNATPAPNAPPTPASTDESAAPADGASEAATKDASPTIPSDASGPAMPWSAALLLGYGFNGAEHLGFGLRGGYTLPMHVYLGATLVYHLGSSDVVSTSLFYPGVEAGYEATLGPVALRPYGGFGPVFVRASLPTQQIAGVTEGGGSSVTTRFGAWNGILAVVRFADRFFAGGDLRLVVVSGYTTVGFFVTGGARF